MNILQSITSLTKSCCIAGLLFFSLHSGNTLAQSFCQGDSVVLVLNGYTGGHIQWQESPDLVTWTPVSAASANNDSLSIMVNATLYYRAEVTDGSCTPFYSDDTLITLYSVTAKALDATSVTPTSFDATWEASPSFAITTYYLDVATDADFTSFLPGFNNLEIQDVSGTLIYTVPGLTCNTPYYYRIRVNGDSCGDGYSATIPVYSAACPGYCTVNSTCTGDLTDSRDNKVYKTVQIGNQCWMAENLNVGTYIDGPIPYTSGTDNQNTSIEKHCVSNNPANCAIYGGLYSWDEMMAYGTSVNTNGPGPQGICPAGWHLPVNNEWKCLQMNLGMSQADADITNSGYIGTDQGGRLKQAGTALWETPNNGGTNSSGFTALPGESWVPTNSTPPAGLIGYWWAATEKDAASGWARYLAYSNPKIYIQGGSKTSSGFSVRCVKNN